jgi:ABC-type branched-subunit amino acid transport system substrate-binding protein
MRTRIFAAVILFATACTPSKDSEEDCWWIGSINPLTGGLGPVGLPLENAAKLAVRDVNAAGGVAGKSLCIATGDDRTNPDRAERIVVDMIERYDIRALNGAAASSATLMAARAAKEADMAIVSCCSTSPEISEDGLIYRTVPSDALQGVALARLAKSPSVNAANVAIIYLDNSYGSALKNEFERAFTEAGRVVVKSVPYLERQSSYANVVSETLGGSQQIDTVALIAYPVEGAQIIRDWQTSGIGRNVKWLGTDGLKDDNFVLAVGAEAPQFVGTAPIPNGEYYDGFVERYTEAYGGEQPGIFTSNQYDAVILIALAFAQVGGSVDLSDVRDAIPEISREPGVPVNADDLSAAILAAETGDVNYEGVSGKVDLDERGDVVSGYRVWSISGSDSGIQEENTCFNCTSEAGTVTCSEATCS